MTAKAALIKHLLTGDIINVKTCFSLIGLTNCAREVSRMVEKPFGVIVSRMRMEGSSRYGQPVSWVDYRLNPMIPGNPEGIKKMVQYLMEQGAVEKTGHKTDNQAKETTYKKNNTTAAQYASNIIKQSELF
jgi:hypothetical protein